MRFGWARAWGCVIACVIVAAIASSTLLKQSTEPPGAPAKSNPAFEAYDMQTKERAANPTFEMPVLAPVDQAAQIESPWDKRHWIEKAARVLRAGETVSPFENMEELERQSKEEIARAFMKSERFADSVLDFNMYFLGYKVDQLKTEGSYNFDAFDFSNAIKSAKAVMNGGDYLSLFDLEGEYYMPPLTSVPTEHEKLAGEERLSPSALREKAIGEIFGRIEDLIELVDNPTPADRSEMCEAIEDLVEAQGDLVQKFNRAFTDEEYFVLTRANVPDFVFDKLAQILERDCADALENNNEIDPIEAEIWTLNSRLHTAFEEILKFEPDRYHPETVAQFKPLDRSAFPAAKPWPVFGYKQSTSLANSLTNYNRKRSAYVLSRYFCDDLMPVGFDKPKEHVGGVHGSDTSCFSCHYKLDPMAGFFRNYGNEFSNASGSDVIEFDDGAKMPMSKYLKTWRAPESPEGDWDVGYIRSARWKDKNVYGSSLADLSKIIREAPEAKRCLMKRLTQYMLGEAQTVDGAYLDALTENFTREAAQNSSDALKNAMVRIVTSNAFQQRNPDSSQCYDIVSTGTASNRPPCRIAYILEKNCVQCHEGSLADTQLDLSRWSKRDETGLPNFPNFDNAGKPVKPEITLAEIAERLTSNNPKTRMPKNKVMSSQERQELYLWVQDELARRRISH